MINNRQGGRRRGRGGQRPQGMGGNPGNRQDNRQRGNAAQLLEKYKNMARDAQLAGDRVQTEYYLQFADHYFRVLEENRSRFEDQDRRRRRDEDDSEDEGDELEIEAEDGEPDSDVEDQQQRQRPRRERAPRERAERQARVNGNARDNDDRDDGEGIAAVLPPSIGVEDDSGQPEGKPRRRRLKPRGDDGEDIAPAA